MGNCTGETEASIQKKKKTSRQSFTHTHTHQDRKLPNYFHLPDTVPFLWSAKITQKIKNNLLVLVYHWVRGERRGWGGAAEKAEKSKCPHQHLTCGTRYPHTHEPLSHTHTSLRGHFLSQIVQPEPVCQSSACFANLAFSGPNGTWLSPVTMTQPRLMMFRAALGRVMDSLMFWSWEMSLHWLVVLVSDEINFCCFLLIK